MPGTYSNLYLITLDSEQHGRTCNYWYLVRAHGHTPHTSFTERRHLLAWMEDRGLALTAEMPEHGEWSGQNLSGRYNKRMHWDYSTFAHVEGKHTRTLSNGEYTLGILTRDADGIVTEHYLNPNCRLRPVFDYTESRALYG